MRSRGRDTDVEDDMNAGIFHELWDSRRRSLVHAWYLLNRMCHGAVPTTWRECSRLLVISLAARIARLQRKPVVG